MGRLLDKHREKLAEKGKVPIGQRPGFQIFKQILPQLAGGIASVFPGGGVVKGIIDGVTQNVNIDRDAREQAVDFLLPIQKEEEEIDALALELRSIQDAREAEIQRLKSKDWLVRNIVPLLAMKWSIFTVTLIVLDGMDVMETENVNHVINIIMLIIGYYFGSSIGSKEKTESFIDGRQK